MIGLDAAVVNVRQVIDDGPVTAFQVRAIALCALVAFLDGLDSQSIAVAAPIIADTIGLQRSALGSIFSAGVLGAMLGALTFGPLGDRFGRKRVLVAAAVIFGVFTIFTAWSGSHASLLATRFLAGIGLGGAVPCYIALSSEYAPQSRRAMVASLIWAAFPLGVSLGSFLNAAILVKFGWQMLFLIGGALPITLALALAIWLPESINYMIAAGANPARVRATMARLRPGAPANIRYVNDGERGAGTPLAHLFADGRAAQTTLLWVSFFMGFGILGITVLWTPVLMRDHGIALSQASVVLGVSGLGSLVGMASAGRMVEAFGARAVLVPSFLLGAVAVGTIGYAAASVPAMAAALFLTGLFVGAGASGSLALAALIYPTFMRSTGIGWAMGMGRFGQVLAPLLAAATVTAGWTGTQLFLLFATAPVLGALAILGLHSRGRLAVGAALT